MISREDIDILYKWAKNIQFVHKNRKFMSSLKNSYWNGDIWMYQMKRGETIRKSTMTTEVYNIHCNPDIFTSFLVKIDSNSIALPHKDPAIYSFRSKRLQIPLRVEEDNMSFMIYNGETFYWKEGIPFVFDVERVVHEGKNLSQSPVEFLMMDVNFDIKIEI